MDIIAIIAAAGLLSFAFYQFGYQQGLVRGLLISENETIRKHTLEELKGSGRSLIQRILRH